MNLNSNFAGMSSLGPLVTHDAEVRYSQNHNYMRSIGFLALLSADPWLQHPVSHVVRIGHTIVSYITSS